MSVDAVILAGGYSSRAKAFKMELKIGNTSVLQYVIEAFLPLCTNIIVVGGYEKEKLVPLIEPYKERVHLVFNEEYDKGMFSSVLKGIKEVKSERFFLTPGDYPLITTGLCKGMLERKEPILIPSCNKKGGHPILLSRDLITEIEEESEESNLKNFLTKKSIYYYETEEVGVLLDLDTREDYEAIRKRMMIS